MTHRTFHRPVWRIVATSWTCTLFLLSACSDSDDNPAAPPDNPAVTIGPEGGSITAGDDLHLYIPPGVLPGDARVTLTEATVVPAPPAGNRQVGRALDFSVEGSASATGYTLAMEFGYSALEDPDGLAYHSALLHRLVDARSWQPMPLGAAVFPLPLAATVAGPGTYAAFIDTTTAPSAGVVAELYVQVHARLHNAAAPFMTTASASFCDPRREIYYVEGGTGPQIDRLTLEPYQNGYFQVADEDISDPGRPCVFSFTTSELVPLFEQSLTWFDEPLRLTNPAEPGLTVSRDEPLTLAWEGIGPRLIWLAVYGDGADGDFLFIGDMTPNDGVFVLETDQLQRFAANATATVFLQDIRGDRLDAPGLHPSSMISMQAACSQQIVVE